MDCEKFDEHVIDALYGELDELTEAALKRHTEGCARCASILAGLKATRENATLALEEPSADLEARILEGERTAQRAAPWPRKLMRAAAWAGSHAMRPQLAMAALFMLVVGSSLLLLRARPGTGGAPVEVTERGAPSPAATASPEAVRGRGTRSMGDMGGLDGKNEAEPKPAALSEDKPKKDSEAPAQAAAPAAAPAPPPGEEATAAMEAGKGAPGAKEDGGAGAALAKAREARSKSGCADALAQFGYVSKNFPATPEAEAARREALACQNEAAAGGPTAAKSAAKVQASAAKPGGDVKPSP
jgi:hypothetical protein